MNSNRTDVGAIFREFLKENKDLGEGRVIVYERGLSVILVAEAVYISATLMSGDYWRLGINGRYREAVMGRDVYRFTLIAWYRYKEKLR